MPTLTLPPPTEARKGERTRAAILATAARSFRVDGFEGTTLAGIAEQLGITRSAVLHHWVVNPGGGQPNVRSLLNEFTVTTTIGT